MSEIIASNFIYSVNTLLESVATFSTQRIIEKCLYKSVWGWDYFELQTLKMLNQTFSLLLIWNKNMSSCVTCNTCLMIKRVHYLQLEPTSRPVAPTSACSTLLRMHSFVFNNFDAYLCTHRALNYMSCRGRFS